MCSRSSAHDTGLVTLQVAVSNQIISNSVVFEYKARALPSLPSAQHDWLSLDGKSRSNSKPLLSPFLKLPLNISHMNFVKILRAAAASDSFFLQTLVMTDLKLQ